MQIDVLQLFCTVARERSISQAARLHGVTQSAASQRVKSLERELGIRLINRGSRPLQLTTAGEIYYQGCQDILQRYAQLKKRLVNPLDTVGGTVRVAAIYSAGIDFLNQAVRLFETTHPAIHVHVDYEHPAIVHKRVRDQDVDFGVLSYPRKWPDLSASLLRNETMVAVCVVGHPLSKHTKLTPADLDDTPLVGFDSGSPIASEIGAYLRRNGGDPELNHTFDNIDTIKTFIAHSEEIGILPHRTVQREVSENSLAAIPLEPAVHRPLAIVTPPYRPQSAAATALIEALLDEDASKTESNELPS